jgi:hypothetical protein
VTSAKLGEFLGKHLPEKSVAPSPLADTFEEVADRAVASCGLVLSYKSE